MAVIDNLSGPSPLMVLTPNMRALWARITLSSAPVITDGAGIKSVSYAATGILTVTFVHAFPKGLYLAGQQIQRAAGSYGFARLTSVSAAGDTATVETYGAASGVAPSLFAGSTAEALTLLFLAVER
jgi:hypothetical protein